MIGPPLGINSKWISTKDNKIADDISCIKKQSVLDISPIVRLLDSHTEVPGADSLSFLPDTAQANLAHMGDRIDREGAMSRRDKEIETEATQQAHYIKWAQVMNIADPCGHQRGYKRIVAIYIKYLMSGVNFKNKDFLRLDMVRGYATSINALFKQQDMKPPVNVAGPNNISGILINNLVKEEDIARQRSPLDSDIFTELLCKSNVSWSWDSKHSTFF
jgi:hypothetical protein